MLDDAITNITLSTTPALITKQRANADKVRAAGFEFEGDVRLPSALTVTLATGIVKSQFTGTGSLSGKHVPQVPEVQRRRSARATSDSAGPRRRSSASPARSSRTTRMRSCCGGRPWSTSMRAAASSRQLQAFVAVENLFDSEYDVGRTPILTTGLPRAVRAGVQIALP